jgi:hypothetical protein
MILKIIATNFSAEINWLFKLIDNSGREYFVMQEGFYKNKGLKSSVTKDKLDTLDIKQNVDCVYELIDEKILLLNSIKNNCPQHAMLFGGYYVHMVQCN